MLCTAAHASPLSDRHIQQLTSSAARTPASTSCTASSCASDSSALRSAPLKPSHAFATCCRLTAASSSSRDVSAVKIYRAHQSSLRLSALASRLLVFCTVLLGWPGGFPLAVLCLERECERQLRLSLHSSRQRMQTSRTLHGLFARG